MILTDLIGSLDGEVAYLTKVFAQYVLDAISLENGVEPKPDREDRLLDTVVEGTRDAFPFPGKELSSFRVSEALSQLLQLSDHLPLALADHVGAQAPTVSQHLAKLRMARLVKARRDGNKIFYAADNAHVRHLVKEALFHTDHVVNDLPDRDDEAVPSTVQTRGRRA